MLFSTLRYIWMGWVDTQLVDPVLHFSYFGFDWVAPLPRTGMYMVFGMMAVACLAITFGWYYRIAAITFFILFTYVELIDITYYLNHYYFVSLVAFLLIWVPANRLFSMDVRRTPQLRQPQVSRWCVDIFKVQIAVVYMYAGLAKINYDWLMRAMPLAIWLPAKTSLPVIGWTFKYKLTAYLFSWMGMLFDTFVVSALMWKRTRLLAYAAVVIFHTITGLLFQIGVFPVVMIMVVTIFFSPAWHERLITRLSGMPLGGRGDQEPVDLQVSGLSRPARGGMLLPFLYIFFLFQLVFPWRYLIYPGNIFWTEEGYRFAWRVMLMEKAGTATFYVKDGEAGREGSVINHQFLNPHQEKQMAMQPDLILQFAHYLRSHFQREGLNDPQVRAEVWVTLNGRPAQLLIDPQEDLTRHVDGWRPKHWITSYKQETSR